MSLENKLVTIPRAVAQHTGKMLIPGYSLVEWYYNAKHGKITRGAIEVETAKVIIYVVAALFWKCYER